MTAQQRARLFGDAAERVIARICGDAEMDFDRFDDSDWRMFRTAYTLARASLAAAKGAGVSAPAE